MIRKKAVTVFVFWVCATTLFLAIPESIFGEDVDDVLSSAEALFKAEQAKRYEAIWPLLTEKTKHSIVDAVHRELRKSGTRIEPEEIDADFAAGGKLAKAYWDEYLRIFKPAMALDESRWSIGALGKDKAEINLLHKKSTSPAILKLYKEANFWKVGLSETFGARNLMPF